MDLVVIPAEAVWDRLDGFGRRPVGNDGDDGCELTPRPRAPE